MIAIRLTLDVKFRRTTITNSGSVLFYVAWPKHVLLRDVCNKKEVWKKLLRNANDLIKES